MTTNKLTLRIVYDGPPYAGKTATIEALAEGLNCTVKTPATKGERTLFFDWAEYQGGSFEGQPIRCELVSVPGQRDLRQRREAILLTADVVVFVADSTASRVAASRSALLENDALFASIEGPAPPMLIQVNKRDREDAVALSLLVEALELDPNVPILETEAQNGRGIRESFLQAVRLGLNSRRRTRESSGGPVPNHAERTPATAKDLLHELASEEARFDVDALADAGEDFLDTDEMAALAENSHPLASVEPGLVWPPVEGRSLISSARNESIAWLPQKNGVRLGVGNRWLVWTNDNESFSAETDAREHLLAQARRHSENRRYLGTGRCLVVLPFGSTEWVLWQLARRRPTLREAVESLVWSSQASAETVHDLFCLWTRAREAEQRLLDLPDDLLIGLENLSDSGDESPFVGLCHFGSPARTEPVSDQVLLAFPKLLERLSLDGLTEVLEELGATGREAEGRFAGKALRVLQSTQADSVSPPLG